MIEELILRQLLQKYESSKHLLEPGTSPRRVMLQTDQKDLPGYDYENAETRDAYNLAAKKLARENLIQIEWFPNRPVFSTLVLNLDLSQIKSCYSRIGEQHPAEKTEKFCEMLDEAMQSIGTEWIKQWYSAVRRNAKTKYKLPKFCRDDFSPLKDLLVAFQAYDALCGESITMRTFSSRCYHDTKYFERHVRAEFINIAKKYNLDLAEAMEQSEMQIRDQQAFLGIYARPELYELAGVCEIQTQHGEIDLAAAGKYGLAIPSTAVDEIISFRLNGIRKVIMIANKTNYDEFLLNELEEDTVVIFHGGFLSPQKKKFITKLAESMPKEAAAYFWADIDLGGFQMFAHLQRIIPKLKPMRMDARDVIENCETGLQRDKTYLEKLANSLNNHEFPYFEEAIQEILKCGVTIEQECFLV